MTYGSRQPTVKKCIICGKRMALYHPDDEEPICSPECSQDYDKSINKGEDL